MFRSWSHYRITTSHDPAKLDVQIEFNADRPTAHRQTERERERERERRLLAISVNKTVNTYSLHKVSSNKGRLPLRRNAS